MFWLRDRQNIMVPASHRAGAQFASGRIGCVHGTHSITLACAFVYTHHFRLLLVDLI